MARHIEFDGSRAVNRALALYWRKGCQATSLADLVAAMGISRSSFWAAFTDKRHWGCMLVNTVLEMAGVDDVPADIGGCARRRQRARHG
jgi:AcrR family transcriptional regulator